MATFRPLKPAPRSPRSPLPPQALPESVAAATGGYAPYVGFNCYQLLTRAADPGSKDGIVKTLDYISEHEPLKVVRCWAFCDGPTQWNTLQPRPGELDPRVLGALDWVVAEAGMRNLRLQMTLTNFWKDFGGMPQYLAWANPNNFNNSQLPGQGDAFFDDRGAQELFLGFAEKIVTRYRNNPTVYAWDLVNEPRCGNDTTGKVARWLDSTAAFVKSIDPETRVTAGLEGFFGATNPGFQQANPFASPGVDFMRDFASPHLDFATIHLYTDWLGNARSNEDKLMWAAKWLRAHIEACSLLGKPLCIQELGEDRLLRSELFRTVLAECRGASNVVEGVLVWMFAHSREWPFDKFAIYGDDSPGDLGLGLVTDYGLTGVAERLIVPARA